MASEIPRTGIFLRSILPAAVPPADPGGKPAVVSRKAYEDTVRLMGESGEIRGALSYEEFLR
jgi:hypothetical protein